MDLNERGRQQAQRTLLSLYDNPMLDNTQIIEGVLEFAKTQKIESTAERQLLGRLELLLLVVNKVGILPKWGDWRILLNTFVMPSLNSQHRSVR